MSSTAPDRLRVCLVSTAALSQPGSMRAFADTVVDALSRHAPEIDFELVELDPSPAPGAWASRLQTVLLPARARAERRRAPDVWHVLDGSRAYVAAALGDSPVVVTVHDIIPWLQARGDFPGAPPVGMAARWLWRANGRAYRAASALLSVSTRSKTDVQEAFQVPADKVRLVLNPLRPPMVEASETSDASTPGGTARNEGMVLHVGNNGFYKNRSQALRLFARLDASVARRLIMAGPPPTAPLVAQAQALGIEARIQWVNDPGDDELADCYRRATLLLFPSLYEGFGWPVLEAMAFGLPVVSSDSGSLPEVLGAAGVCLPLHEEDRFAAAMDLLLRSPQAVEAAAKRGKVQAAAFATQVFARELVSAYADAARSGRMA